MNDDTLIREIRTMHGFGLVSTEQAVRMERFYERYPDVRTTEREVEEIANYLAEHI